MKKIILFITVLAVFQAFSQIDNLEQNQVSYTNKNLLKLNFFVPGAEFEYGVSNNRSLAISAGYWQITTTENHNKSKTYSAVLPYVSYRNYYNIEKRKAKGKQTENFNANYIALQGFYKPTLGERGQRIGWGASWGIQHNYGKLFHFGFELGLGYGPNGFYLEGKNELFPHADLQLGFMFR